MSDEESVKFLKIGGHMDKMVYFFTWTDVPCLLIIISGSKLTALQAIISHERTLISNIAHACSISNLFIFASHHVLSFDSISSKAMHENSGQYIVKVCRQY